MQSFFITGTDTGVGKTFLSAALLMHAHSCREKGHYYKPIQTGGDEDSDTRTVLELTKGLGTITTSCGITFKRPLSPHLAAYYDNAHIDFTTVAVKTRAELGGDFTIVEGAGGLLVPINGRHLMIDLIKELAIPSILVSRSTLGCINHTLLSLEALYRRRIPVWGVVMVGAYNRDNEMSIKYYGRSKNVLCLPFVTPLTKTSLAQLVDDKSHEFERFLSHGAAHDH